mgnify:CR=1 FL=1
MGALAVLSFGKVPTAKMFQFNGIFPTMNQCRAISAVTYSGRIVSSANDNELKETAGFGKGGEKNFDGIVTGLQMQTYLVMKDLRKRHKKDGAEYGWSVAIYSTPEAIWGKKVTSAYKENPEKSKERIYKQMTKLYSYAFDDDIWKVIR